jgi:hypothetical protein
LGHRDDGSMFASEQWWNDNTEVHQLCTCQLVAAL